MKKKIKAFVLPGGDIVAGQYDEITKAGFPVAVVARMSNVEWSSLLQCWCSWSNQPIGLQHKLAASEFREECVQVERVVVDSILREWILNHKAELIDSCVLESLYVPPGWASAACTVPGSGK